MWRTSVFFCLFVILVAIGRSHSSVSSFIDGEEKWFEQRLDHFDERNNRTWLMRFYENDQFFNGSGPIFISLGGEGAISPNDVQSGILFENAKVHGAMMYHTEHRYYGKSHPTPDLSFENLRYLRVNQTLADVAFFIETKKRELNISNSVIVFGGSYAGNLATWMRLKYPHLVQGALASSAPVHVKGNFFEYNEFLTNSLRNYDEKCVSNTKEAISKIESLLRGDNPDPEKIQKDFNLCLVPDTTQVTDFRHVIHALARMFSDVVQFNKVGADNKTSIGNLCDSLTIESSNETAYDRLAAVFRRSQSSDCSFWNHQIFMHMTHNPSNRIWLKIWYYQACREFGFHQTSNSTNSIFGSLLPLEYFVQMCQDFYGEDYNADILYERAERTNERYGSNSLNVTNVIFTNGDADPWHLLSVLSDLNEHSPSIIIKGGSHCQDLFSESPTDSEELKKARQKIAKTIAQEKESSVILKFFPDLITPSARASHCEDLYGMSGADSEDMKTAQQKIARIITQWLKEK